MKHSFQQVTILIFFAGFIAFSCDDSTGGEEITISENIIPDIPAEVQSIISTTAPYANIPGDTAGTGKYTFFDLDTGEIIEDSTSALWDIGFSQTTIIANTGKGGGLQIAEQGYDEVVEAPADNYVANTSEASSDWYEYIPSQFRIEVLENRTIFILTPDGNYAKVEMSSYYFNEDFDEEPRYFTFFYTLQQNGTQNLSNTVYYDIDELEIVESPGSPQWDIAFGASTIYANTQNGGGILALNTAFQDVDEAPVSGYQSQNRSWYNYTGPMGNPPHAVLPVDDLTLVLQTPDGNYAKIKVLSYYEGNPDTSTEDFANTSSRPDDRYYTFELVYQTNGSRFFE